VASDPFDTLVNRLARREHSRVELDRKLKTYHPELSLPERNKLLDRLIELNLQSDTRFAEMLIRSRLFRGHGRRRIEQELAQHAIDARDVSHHFDDAEGSESERCVAALEKWMRSKKDPTRDKALRFLASRGFNFSDATEAVDAIFR
jgi:regulatory protein